ncbi:MAG: hypothetical protein ACN4GW_05920 [Desulforhopalus sp.]
MISALQIIFVHKKQEINLRKALVPAYFPFTGVSALKLKFFRGLTPGYRYVSSDGCDELPDNSVIFFDLYHKSDKKKLKQSAAV